MDCYFVEMMYGKSCTKFPYFVAIILYSRHRQFLFVIGQLRKIFSNHLSKLIEIL